MQRCWVGFLDGPNLTESINVMSAWSAKLQTHLLRSRSCYAMHNVIRWQPTRIFSLKLANGRHGSFFESACSTSGRLFSSAVRGGWRFEGGLIITSSAYTLDSKYMYLCICLLVSCTRSSDCNHESRNTEPRGHVSRV